MAQGSGRRTPTRAARGGALPARYQMEGELARGGMGIVYRALDRERGYAVAVKMLAPPPRQDLVAFLRFAREASTASSLHHPNICRIFDIGEFRRRPFIVMELLEGETVKSRMARGACDTAFAVDIVRQIASGLAAVHERFIIHRDIKPANVFITTDGTVKLLDFGIAKHFAAVDQPTEMTVTELGHAPGTVQYMSPEQLLGSRLDPRTDLFSLGVLLYELLCGRRPFEGSSQLETIAAILHKSPPPLPLVPFFVEWTDILGRLLAKDPEHRYQSATALLRDLDLLDRRRQGEPVIWPSARTAHRMDAPLSLAILPFSVAGASGDGSDSGNDVAYLCYSLVDALAVRLSRVDGLRVVPRTLVGRTSRKGRPRERIGRQLHADRLLMGTVTRQADTLTATLELVDVATDQVRWTRAYTFSPEDLFTLGDDIVRDVLGELGLSRAEPPKLAAPETGNRQAFQLVLKGRFFWSRRYEDGLLKALECFRGAIGLDPRLALAHAGLADTYSFLGFYSLRRPRTAYADAEGHARQALELDPDLAQAHTSLGLVKLGGDWNWEGARASFQEAIRLDPSHALARCYLSWTHVLLDRVAEAHAEAERAQDIDPLSPMLNAAAAYTFFLSRSYERAIRECEKALEIDHDFLIARYVMALCKGELGFREDAIRDLELAVRLSGEMVFYLALLGKMYGDTGQKPFVAKARAILNRFDELRAAGRYVGPHAYVYVYTGLGDFDAAFTWHAKAFEDGASPFNYLSPQLSPLHKDPRFLRDLRAWNPALTASAFVRRAVGPTAAPAALPPLA